MQATTRADAFALRNSGLGAFLYADVGAELNGSALTILSMIARLGRDPWAEAAGWAALPRAGVIDSLAQCIAQMPLVPAALAQTRVTAERLVQLLPAATQDGPQGNGANAEAAPVSKWVPITMLYCALLLGAAFSAVLMPRPPQAGAAPSMQATEMPGSTGPAAVRRPPGAATLFSPMVPTRE